VRLQGEEQSKDGRTRVGEETNEGTKKVREREGKVSQADKDAKASWDESRSGKKKRIGLTSWEVGSSKGIQRGARGRQRGRVEREEDGSREVDWDGGGEMSEGGRERLATSTSISSYPPTCLNTPKPPCTWSSILETHHSLSGSTFKSHCFLRKSPAFLLSSADDLGSTDSYRTSSKALTVPKLKEILTSKDLPVSGKKEELISRILASSEKKADFDPLVSPLRRSDHE
jgi:hypothetical protein